MAHFRLSTDIFSPIQSDISLNDTSTFSFGSLTGTSTFGKEVESPQDRHVEKESDGNVFQNSTMREGAFEFVKKKLTQQSSIDIFSPIRSDVLLNDASASSFESSMGTPEFEKKVESSQVRHVEKESGHTIYHNNAMREGAFELRTREIKKWSSINAEKEKKFKPTYEHLKQSLDNLLLNKMPAIQNQDGKNLTENIESNLNLRETEQKPQNAHKSETYLSPELKELSRTVTKTGEKNLVESKSKVKQENNKGQQPKSASELKEFGKNSHGKLGSKVNLHSGTKNNTLHKSDKTNHSKMVSSSTQTCEYLQVISHDTVTKENKSESLMDKLRNKTEKFSNSENLSQNLGKEGMSLEKSIQLAVSMEFDKIRGLMLDNKMNVGKEILKLQEMVKNQSEVSNYLLAVIEELAKENKKLRSVHK